MLKKMLLLAVLGFAQISLGQESPYRLVKISPGRDTIQIDSVSINKVFFKLQHPDGTDVDSSHFKVDFAKAILIFRESFSSPDSLTMRYLRYPDYLTRRYSLYNKDQVVQSEAGVLYRANRDPLKRFVPFEGLTTSGSITRGVTVGNNQNAVVNSNLDLQISGKLSDKVSLKASIQDSNIPLQESGYSQRLDEFDQIFIEISGEKWAVRAGDLFLENRQSRFMNFNKKVQGISSTFRIGDKEKHTTLFGSGAIVRGQYARSSFTGQEGNQGPYKLRGPNNELFILIISGSERVFVNGILLRRGENNDYVIDYNAGEIRFTSLFPITSEMRINVEYQFSDRNYTRFVGYGGAIHEQEKWSLGGFVYSESDVKNQPLQQNLSQEQAQILAGAGDDPTNMTAPSAFVDSYSENKILYRKVSTGGVEFFEYSNNPADELYNVRFTLVGNGLGNYILASSAAIGKIYQYVPPQDGVLQGNYEPITRLIAPVKLQLATMMGRYSPSDKTSADFEVAVSNNDQNLFSNLDDGNNAGFAGKFNARKRLFSGKWHTDAFANYQRIDQDFRTIERLFTIEFDRDWNLTLPRGDQSLLIAGLSTLKNPDSLGNSGFAKYQFEKLDFSENFSGSRHVAESRIRIGRWQANASGSYLKSDGEVSSSSFARAFAQGRRHFGKNWAGGSFRFEDNQETIKQTGLLSALSQRFAEYGAFVGRGDSTKVFAELGFLRRRNDSLQSGFLKRVNNSQSYYLKSKLIQTELSDLSVFVNYRTLDFTDAERKSEQSLNSRILYNDRYFNQFVQLTAAYETTSGTIPQQEFTYLEVEPGQGVYMWNDYNQNGVQELEEFEVAPFPDQAKYVRVFLPNQVFIRTHQNKFSASVNLNPTGWQNEAGIKKIISYFFNQTSYLADRRIVREGGNFDLNPFAESREGLLGLNASFRNSLFYNRGKQDHSLTYTFLNNRARNLLSVGSQETSNHSHQIQYAHLYKTHWLFSLSGKTIASALESENFQERNFEISGYQAAPKISYLFSKNAAWDVFFEYQLKENEMGLTEVLKQQRIGTSFNFATEKKLTLNGEFSYYQNDFIGNPNSPVAFQMLEGLQPGENLTWRMLVQKNLTQYLDININYQGRKSETAQAIHTGNIQLRAFF